jgi:predicted dinucleotide-utilizing enzyme
VVESVLIKVTFRADKDVLEESAEMFSKLNAVVNFHCQGGFIKGLDILEAVSAVAVSSQECRHEAARQEDKVSKNGRQCVVNDGKSPLDNCVASFFPLLFCWVLDMADIVFVAKGIKKFM